MLSAPQDPRTQRPLHRGGLASPPAAAPRPDAGERSPLIDLTPHVQTIQAYFSRILRPANLWTHKAHMPALYGLARLRVPQDTGGRGVAFVGADMHLDPPDYNGNGQAEDTDESGTDGIIAASSGAGCALPWGDAAGRTACVIVGLNLPIVPDAWCQGPIYLPGIQNATRHYLSAAERPEYLAVGYFPPGQYADANNGSRLVLSFNTRNGSKRLQAGSTLDVALCVRAGQVGLYNPTQIRYLCGQALVQIHLNESRPRADFGY